MASSLFRNTLAQTMGTGVSFATSIALAPVMVSRLGLAVFGIWAVTGAAAQYAGLLDLGVTRATRRFIAFYHAHGDDTAVAQSVGLGLIVASLIALVLTPAAVLAAPAVARALDAPPDLDIRVVLGCSSAILVLTAYTTVLAALPEGFNRMVPSNVAKAVGQLVNFAVSLTVLLATRDLEAYAIANVVAAVISLAFMAMAARYVQRGRIAAWPGAAVRRATLHYALSTQVRWLALLVQQQTDKVVLAVLIDTRAAAVYEIANRVVLAVAAAGALSVSALVPQVTSDLVRRGRGYLAEFYATCTTRVVSVALPVYVITIIVAPYLLRGWIGEASVRAVATVVVLSAAYLTTIVTGVASTVSDADGRPEIVARAAAWSALANVVLTVALVPLVGFGGVLAGTAAAVVLGVVILMGGFQRRYAFRASDTINAVRTPLVLAVALGAPLAVAAFAMFDEDIDRLTAVAVTCGLATAYLAMYWPLASRLGLLPAAMQTGRLRLARARPEP